MKPSQVLKSPRHWVKGRLAVTSRGVVTCADNPRAVRFCLLGAVHRATWINRERDRMVAQIRAALPFEFGNNIADFNDCPTTTFRDVKAVLRKAKL